MKLGRERASRTATGLFELDRSNAEVLHVAGQKFIHEIFVFVEYFTILVIMLIDFLRFEYLDSNRSISSAFGAINLPTDFSSMKDNNGKFQTGPFKKPTSESRTHAEAASCSRFSAAIVLWLDDFA